MLAVLAGGPLTLLPQRLVEGVVAALFAVKAAVLLSPARDPATGYEGARSPGGFSHREAKSV